MVMSEARAQATWAHTSSVMALIANVNRDPKKTKEFRPSDFNPLLGGGKRPGIPLRADTIDLLKVFVKE